MHILKDYIFFYISFYNASFMLQMCYCYSKYFYITMKQIGLLYISVIKKYV